MTTPSTPDTQFEPAVSSGRASLWLLVALLLNLVIGGVTALALVSLGESPNNAARATAPGFSREAFRGSRGIDSWKPMALAYHRDLNGKSLYSVQFEQGIKFQYPPSSLLPFDLIPSAKLANSEGIVSEEFRALAGLVSQTALFGVVIVSVFILEIGLRRLALPGIGHLPLRIVLTLMLGLTFYPLIKAHSLGQIQIYLDLLIATAVLAHLLGRPVLAGICLGICGLVKPQLGLVLVWALLRRNWRFSAAMTLTVAAGAGLAILRFGWSNHVEYVAVLRNIAQHGEVFWPNQSINGLLHRFFENGNPAHWTANAYAPYDAYAHYLTLFSSLALLVLALAPWRKLPPRPNLEMVDFAIVLIAVTIASPVAWEHHYGILLSIYAAMLPILLQTAALGRWTVPIVTVAFAATANVLLRPELIFANRWIGLGGSHLLFGGLLLFVVLLATRVQLLKRATPAPALHPPNT